MKLRRRPDRRRYSATRARRPLLLDVALPRSRLCLVIGHSAAVGNGYDTPCPKRHQISPVSVAARACVLGQLVIQVSLLNAKRVASFSKVGIGLSHDVEA